MDDAGTPDDHRLWELLSTFSGHAVIILSAEGTVTAWLGAARLIFGYTREEALGLDFGALFTPEDRRLALDRQEMASAARTGSSEDDRWHVRKDGSLFWASGVLYAARRADGSVMSYCKVVRDRTDMQVQVEMLRNRIAAHEREHERRTRFLISLSHELRNPLGGIQNAFFLLSHADGQEVKVKANEVLSRQLPLMTRLLDDLVDAAQSSLGKTRIQFETLNVQDALQCAADSVRPSAEQKGQEFLLTVPPVPFMIEADPARLQQMLLNLLTNAVKFTPQGGSIQMSASVEAGMLVIRVRDNGIGISPRVLPGIFDLFVREETQEPVSGLGVGLAVVKELAALHGGGVEVRSPGTGQGAVFTLRLPLRRPAKADGERS